MRNTRKSPLITVVAPLADLYARHAGAQANCPDRPIEITVPFPLGVE